MASNSICLYDHAKNKTTAEGKNVLEIYKAGQNKKITQTVLEEEEYLEHIDKIVERDYFPEYSMLKAKKEYMQAESRQDYERMREILVNNRELCQDESLRESLQGLPNQFSLSTKNADALNPEILDPSSRSLDSYLNKYTSEDNALFLEVLSEAEKSRKRKLEPLYINEMQILMQSQVPSTNSSSVTPSKEDLDFVDLTDGLAIVSVGPTSNGLTGNEARTIETFPTYQAHNALMFPPDCVPLTATELTDALSKKRTILPEHTRFKVPTNTIGESIKQKLLDSASRKVHVAGQVGPDGRELTPGSTPSRDGYSFVANIPSPRPGSVRAGDESPWMTWGEVEKTPVQLDGSPLGQATPHFFRMHGPSKRETLGLSLVEKQSKMNRDKRKKAMQNMKDRLISPSMRLGTLSPAARLLSSKISRRSSDFEFSCAVTPNLPTPKNMRSTPGTSDREASRRQNLGVDSHTITDNLLDLASKAN